MPIGRKTIVVAVIICSIPVITLTRIYSNFTADDLVSFDDAKTSNVTDINFGLKPSSSVEEVEAKLAPQSVRISPPELEDVESELLALEKTRENLELAALKGEIAKADAMIAEMDELISQTNIGHTKLDDEDFVAAADEISDLQSQMLDATAGTD